MAPLPRTHPTCMPALLTHVRVPTDAQGVDFVFVDHPSFPRPGGLYSDEFGTYGDNQVGCVCVCV